MSGSRLLIGVASVLAGTTVLLGVFGVVYNPVLLVAAVPFAAATYILWSHGTGRLEALMRERARYRPIDEGVRNGPRYTARRTSSDRVPPRAAPNDAPDTKAAASVLGVDPDADDATIRRAYREHAKALHPDAPGGDEAAFRRARDAYERLTGRH